MKFDEFSSIAHNIANPVANEMVFPIGIYQIDIFVKRAEIQRSIAWSFYLEK